MSHYYKSHTLSHLNNDVRFHGGFRNRELTNHHVEHWRGGGCGAGDCLINSDDMAYTTGPLSGMYNELFREKLTFRVRGIDNRL